MAFKHGLTARLYQPIGLMQHLLEMIRYLVIHVHPCHLSPRLTIDLCPACMTALNQIIDGYPRDQLNPLYQTIQLVHLNFRTAIKTPSLVTTFERKIRGWGNGPPPENHLAQLMLLGCLPELYKMDEMQGSYPKRLNIVTSFCDKVAESVSYNSASIEDFYQTETDPVMAGKKSSSQAQQDVRLGLEVSADESKWGVRSSLDVSLDLLTEGMLKSVPTLDKILVGQKTFLGHKVMDLELCDEQEMASPYQFLHRMLAESYNEKHDNAVQVREDTDVDVYNYYIAS